jgi:uncharacterized NAD(P)/FAD-binding protein YdhS
MSVQQVTTARFSSIGKARQISCVLGRRLSIILRQPTRFLRHLRSHWEVHRHRLAPEIADVLSDMKAEGRCTLTLDASSGIRRMAKLRKYRIVSEPAAEKEL